MLLMSDVNVSVSLLTEIETPLIVNDPLATLPNCEVFESTCWSSRILPLVVLAELMPAADKNPDVSLPIETLSSVLYVVASVSLLAALSNAAVTRAPDALIFDTIDWMVSDVDTLIVLSSTTKDPLVTEAKRDKS